jgi:hypothetical protein
MLVTFAVLMLCVIPTPHVSNWNQFHTNKSTTTLREDTIEDESVDLPNEEAVPAEAVWHWSGVNTLASAPWGSTDYPSRLSDDDGSLCRMSEEWDGANYRFDLRFRTSAIYAHRYLNHELRMDFRPMTDQQVAALMNSFFIVNPHLRSQNLPFIKRWEADPVVLDNLIFLTESPDFRAAYNECLTQGQAQADTYVMGLVQRLIPDLTEAARYCNCLLDHLSEARSND